MRNGTTECSRAGFIDNVPLSAPHAQELRFFWWGLTRAAAAARRQQRREPQQGHMHVRNQVCAVGDGHTSCWHGAMPGGDHGRRGGDEAGWQPAGRGAGGPTGDVRWWAAPLLRRAVVAAASPFHGARSSACVSALPCFIACATVAHGQWTRFHFFSVLHCSAGAQGLGADGHDDAFGEGWRAQCEFLCGDGGNWCVCVVCVEVIVLGVDVSEWLMLVVVCASLCLRWTCALCGEWFVLFFPCPFLPLLPHRRAYHARFSFPRLRFLVLPCHRCPCRAFVTFPSTLALDAAILTVTSSTCTFLSRYSIFSNFARDGVHLVGRLSFAATALWVTLAERTVSDGLTCMAPLCDICIARQWLHCP